MNDKKQTRHIVLLVPHYSTLLDICGPFDVFQKAIEYMNEAIPLPGFTYQTHVVSTRRSKRIDMLGGISLVGEGSYREIDYPIDTLIIGGLSHRPEYKPGQEVLTWIKEQCGKVRRICSVCAGAFILAEAGVLAGKKAATHWMRCDKLAKEYPDTQVDREAIFVKDGHVYTSAGITTGMDLALALIEEDLGKTFALKIARIMVLFLKRPGNQTQYSTVLQTQEVDHQPLNLAIEWIYHHLREDITVEKLADCSRMSPRNFARVFVRELHITPMKYVEKLRLETACRYLTETHLTVNEIADRCGFKNSLHMNRMFLHTFQTTPSQYRQGFRSSFR